MKIAVFGATGATGQLIVQQALAAGHEVVAFARNAANVGITHPSLTIVQGEGASAADVEKAVAGVDAVLNAAGSRTRKKNTVRSEMARAIVAAMKQHGVRRVVYLSAAGVGESLAQAQRGSFVYGRVIIPLLLKAVFADGAIAEETYRTSGLEAVLVRPVGLTNGPESGKAIASADLDVKITGLTISRADVARFMLSAATGAEHVGKAYSLWS